MASLLKRGRYYYAKWQKRKPDGGRYQVKKSLGLTYKDKAQKAMAALERLEEEGKIDPYQKDFEPKKVLEQLNDNAKAKGIYTMRETADYYYKLKSHLASKTLEAYKTAIEYFISFNNLAETPPEFVRLEHFEALIFKPGLKPASRHHYFSQLRTFWNVLLDRNIVKQDYFPMLKKHLPSKKQNMRSKMLTESELHQLFEAFDKELERKTALPEWGPYLAQQWCKPLVCCYFYSGMRKHEAAFSSDIPYSGLKGKNLYYDKGLAAIILEATKGRRERLIPLTKKWEQMMETYIKLRGKPGYDEYLFIYLGGSKKGWPVTGQRVYKEFKRYLKLAKLPKSRTLHGMRHGRITAWLEDGYNTSEAQLMAGHSSSSVTNKYTHLGLKKLIEKQRRLESE